MNLNPPALAKKPGTRSGNPNRVCSGTARFGSVVGGVGASVPALLDRLHRRRGRGPGSQARNVAGQLRQALGVAGVPGHAGTRQGGPDVRPQAVSGRLADLRVGSPSAPPATASPGRSDAAGSPPCSPQAAGLTGAPAGLSEGSQATGPLETDHRNTCPSKRQGGGIRFEEFGPDLPVASGGAPDWGGIFGRSAAGFPHPRSRRRTCA